MPTVKKKKERKKERKERCQITNLTYHLEKEEHTKPKAKEGRK